MPTRSQIHIDKPLTNISVAYMQSADAFVSDKIFPVVPVQKQSDRYFKYLKEDWYRDEAKQRAGATESAGGDYNIDNTPSYFCKKYAYHKDVTEEDRVNADAPLTPDRDATDFVSNKLLLRREIDWATQYFKKGIWSTDVEGADVASASKVLKWSDPKSSPIEDITDAGIAMLSTTGYKPNKLVIGPYVFNALKNHPMILDRIKYTQRGIVTRELLAALFEVEEVYIASAIANTAQQGTDENTNFIFGSNALLVHAAKRPGLKTPSAGYTFAWTGLMGAGAFGNRVVRLPMDHLGIGTERIEGEMAFDHQVVASDLGFFFNGVV